MRRFRIHNISGSSRAGRVWIPITSTSTLVPGYLRGHSNLPVPSVRSSMVVSEDVLRRFVLFYRRGQLSVQSLDGGPLPDFLRSHPEVAPVEVVVPIVEKDQPTVSEPPVEVDKAIDVGKVLSKKSQDVVDFIATIDFDPLSDSLLREMLQAEESGKARKTVIKALKDKLGMDQPSLGEPT